MTRSLQTRLQIGTTLGTTGVLVATGLVLYALIRVELYADFDASLASEAFALATLVEEKNGQIQTEMAEHGVTKFEAKDRPVYYAIWSQQGKLIEKSGNLDSTDLQNFRRATMQKELSAVELPGNKVGRKVGILFIPYQDNNRSKIDLKNGKIFEPPSAVTLVLARDTLKLDFTLRRIGTLLSAVVFGAVVVSTIVTTPIVRVSLYPLKRIAALIKSLEVRDLSGQLDSMRTPAEVQTVVDCLNVLLNRLHGAFQRERAFSSNVAHELRTPWAGLRTTIDVALAKPIKSTESAEIAYYRRSLKCCQDICKQAERITENLLVLARFETDQYELNLESVEINNLLLQTWAPMADRSASNGLTVEWKVDTQLRVRADVAMLSLTLRNLLDNALSYVEPGGHIRISARSEVIASSENRFVTISVQNSAINLCPELTQHVFDRFWRADAARSGNGLHTGLGLSLCREAAQAMEGSLDVASTQTTFEATLRLIQSEADCLVDSLEQVTGGTT